MKPLDSVRSEGFGYVNRIATVLNSLYQSCHEVEQTLGKALHYPWYKDDQKNFPGATEESGVCVGDHVPESIAAEAARRIKELEEAIEWLVDRAMVHSEYPYYEILGIEYEEMDELRKLVHRSKNAN